MIVTQNTVYSAGDSQSTGRSLSSEITWRDHISSFTATLFFDLLEAKYLPACRGSAGGLPALPVQHVTIG
jgi:hypothetical protein